MMLEPQHLTSPTLIQATGNGHVRLGFSQLGEDAVLWHLLQGKRDGFYVDIGCHHPFRFSNTGIFYEFYNWSGLNVDMDEDLIAEFVRARPRDINVTSAVGSEAGTMEATFFHEAAVNSLDPASIEGFKLRFEPKAVRPVEVRTLASLLAEHVPPGQEIDLMDVDVEGLDHDVLLSNDWDRFRPAVLAVESHGFDLSNPAANPTFQLLASKGYRLNSHTIVTSIYTRL